MICCESACVSSSDCLSAWWSVCSHYNALLRQGRKLQVFSWTEPTTPSTFRICIVACLCESVCVCVCVCVLGGRACTGIYTRLRFQYSASFSIYTVAICCEQ